MTDNNTQDMRNDAMQAASEGVMQQSAGDIIDTTTRSISKYVNSVAGDAVIANPDNEIRRILVGLLLAYEERKRDATS